MLGNRMSLVFVVSVEQRQKLTANASTNPSKKFDMSGKLFWRQPLKRVVENGVLKF